MHFSNRRNEPPLGQPSFESSHHHHPATNSSSSVHSVHSSAMNHAHARTERRRTQNHPLPQFSFRSHSQRSPRQSSQRSDNSGLTSRPSSIIEEAAITQIAKSHQKIETVLYQQQLTLDNLIQSNAAFRSSHQSILEQQNEILTQQLQVLKKCMLPTGQSTATPNAPAENSSTGISYAPSGENSDLPFTQENQKPTQVKPPSDDISIGSHHSNIVHMGYQDSKLTINNFKDEWLSEVTPAKLRLAQLTSELAAKPYYHQLLTPNKRAINFQAPIDGPNATLYSVLQNKISDNFKTMFVNCNYTTGTQILEYIVDSINTLRGNKATDAQITAEFYRLEWKPTKETLKEFNGRFQTLYNKVVDTNDSFPFENAKSTWINAMPSQFSDLKSKYNKQNLDEQWLTVNNPGKLWITTQLEIKNCGIQLPKVTSNNKTKDHTKDTTKSKEDSERKGPYIPTKDSLALAKDNHRGAFPTEFPSFEKLQAEIKSMIDSGKTQADVEARFKDTYPYPNCYLCRIVYKKPHCHKAPNCPLLKELFNLYRPNSVASSNNTITPRATRKPNPEQKRKRKKQVPSTPPTIIKMCYDTGTSPKSLCYKKEFFRELILFDKPKFVTLADSETTAEVLGQGTLDLIINQKYRIYIFAYFTANSDALLSAVDHLSYQGCQINGINGKIRVTFPTFFFDVSGTSNFEFSISPGKSSNKPVLWQPHTVKRINVTAKDKIEIKRLHQDATLPQRATEHASGYDIATPFMQTLQPNHATKVPLGFAMSFPTHLQCELRSRSSLALKGIHIALGTIDPDYRGEIAAIVTNTNPETYTLNIGQRIGQLVFTKVSHPPVSEVTSLPQSKRGGQGFGSTGTTKLGSAKRIKPRSSSPTIFLPTLPVIQESTKESAHTESTTHPQQQPLTDITNVSKAVLDKEIEKFTSKDVEEVESIPTPKQVNNDAIHLFPRHLYDSGSLNITGNADLDSTASPTSKLSKQQQKPPSIPNTSSHQVNEDNQETSTSPDTNNQVESENPAFTVESQSQPKSPSKPTKIIEEHLIFDIIDDDNTSVNGPDDEVFTTGTPAPLTSLLDQTLTRPTPRIPPTDRVSSTEPNNKIVTSEYMQKCFGFRNITPILKTIQEQSQNTVTVRDTGNHPILSRGETATLSKAKSNTNPVQKPSEYGQIWHYDIVYGNGRAIGGIQYGLFFVDRKSRKKKIFGLKSLKKSHIASAMKKFVREVGFYPDEIIADRDFKLIGSHIDDIMEPYTQVSGAPGGRQSQNGLSESNWRYICNIARNYLVEHLLPSEFWFFAILYAVQVSNYIPIKTNKNKLTTPFYEAYKKHPDYRKLIPLFSAAYVKIYKSGEGNTLETQTMKAILVGNDDKSDARLFYNPTTKQLIASSDYRLNISCPSGPIFNLEYSEPTTYSLYNDTVTADAPTFDLNQKVYLSPTHLTHPLQPATVLDIPFKHGDPYTLQLQDIDTIIQTMSFDILPYNPSTSPLNDGLSPSITYPWLKHNAKATLYLKDSMPLPKQGIILQDGKSWYFHQGRSLKSKKNRTTHVKRKLPDTIEDIEALIQTKQLASGWQTSKTMQENINSTQTFNFVARRVAFMNTTDPAHLTNEAVTTKIDSVSAPEIIGFSRKVSAQGLSSLREPKLHEHSKLPPSDKEIWDKSYFEEYMGLHEDTQTWDYITEEEYQSLRPVVGNALPTMAISKIKTDENGLPERAKYRIVVLGNLDPHNWSNSDCFAPVLSPLELRLLVAIATQMKRIPKSGDVSQAFVQSFLPDDEKYVIKPPHGCPLTPPKTYLLLKRTLYGLKRSPRHWYETCKKALISLGLQPCPNAPCIFTGTIIEGQPPLYLGLFVDDFIYFSESTIVEETFAKQFSNIYKVDFQDEITHFLGIKFTNVKHEDGNIDIYMNQPKDTQDLITKAGLDKPQTITAKTPYRSGLPVDSIPDVPLPDNERASLNKILQEYTGCLNWLSTQTRPDLATITNIISQYNTKCSPGHIEAAKYAIRYLKGTQNMGIKFSSKNNKDIESFVQFPIDPKKLQSLTDANWGPQDQSVPKESDDPILLELFKSRSIAGFVIWLGGPLTWQSKRQTYTARSSAQAEIGAVDDCTKTIQHIINILTDLNLLKMFQNGPIPIYNDNAACVQWSHNMTTKGLRYIQMRENAVREQILERTINVQHVGGKKNPSDIFTKEDRDITHYEQCRDTLCSTPPTV